MDSAESVSTAGPESDEARSGLASATLARADIGGLTFIEVGTGPPVARTRSSLTWLHLQLEGRSIHRQAGRDALLHVGDFTLCDETRPHDISFDGTNRRLMIGIPDATLRRHIACPESLLAIPMTAANGISALLSRFLTDFWSEYRQGMNAASAARVIPAILDLLAGAYADLPRQRPDHSPLASAHRIRIVSFIEAQLNDPELTPTRIAKACKMTTRYLHHLFSDQDETVARYILRRRLETCSRALLSTAQRGRTVTAIAFDHGFNSPTHFGRVFRSKFGASPRDYRRGRPEGCQAAV